MFHLNFPCRRFQSRQDSQSGPALKGLVTSISCIKGEEELAELARRPGAMKRAGSSLSSAATPNQENTSTTLGAQPIGAGLPLLTRIKMLREAEKAAASKSAADTSRSVSSSTGSNVHFREPTSQQQDRAQSRLEPTAHSSLLERRRLSRLQGSISSSISDASSKSPMDKAPTPRKSLADALHRLKPGSDSLSKQGSTPVTLHVHPPPANDPAAEAVANQNIPLLKRVLLLKAMEDKKEKETKHQTNATATAAPAAEKPSASNSSVKSAKLSPPRPDTLSLNPAEESSPVRPPSRTEPVGAEAGTKGMSRTMLSPKFELEDEVFRSPSPTPDPLERKTTLTSDGGGVPDRKSVV